MGSAQFKELFDIIVALVHIVRARLVRQNEIEAHVQHRKALVHQLEESIPEIQNQRPFFEEYHSEVERSRE